MSNAIVLRSARGLHPLQESKAKKRSKKNKKNSIAQRSRPAPLQESKAKKNKQKQ